MSTSTQTTAAIAAAEIRKRLKAANIKATVKCENFAGGNAVNINLFDEPPWIVKQASDIAEPFEYGHFDGMTDCYQYSNKRPDLPAQVKYVHVNVSTSDELCQRIYTFIRGYYAEAATFPEDCKDAAQIRLHDTWMSNVVWREFGRADSAYWKAQQAA
jgi:hypothetical protein